MTNNDSNDDDDSTGPGVLDYLICCLLYNGSAGNDDNVH